MPSSDAVYGLLYRSLSSTRLSADDAATLAIRSARNNALRGVTGLLLHAEPTGAQPGLFVQWLEGPEDEVRALFETICEDDRHLDCEVTAEGPTAELIGRDGRLFGEWDMHLLRLGELPATLEAFLDVWLSLRMQASD